MLHTMVLGELNKRIYITLIESKSQDNGARSARKVNTTVFIQTQNKNESNILNFIITLLKVAGHTLHYVCKTFP